VVGGAQNRNIWHHVQSVAVDLDRRKYSAIRRIDGIAMMTGSS
jgi:hypothetical protein